MDSLVSVIVPIYKVEAYLSICIQSIINQTYKKLEIILVDDGSPDNCPQICDDFLQIDSRIKVIHKKNGGLSSARNEGLNICTGNYIMFVDSDDMLHPQAIEILLRAIIENNDVDIAVGNHEDCYDLNIRPNKIKNSKVFIRKKEETMNQLLNTGGYYGSCCWKLYKSSIFRKLRFPLGKIYEDTHIMHEVYHNSKCVAEVDSVVYYYLLREDSIMRTHGLNNISSLYDALFKRLLFFKNNQYSNEYNSQKMFIENRLHCLFIESLENNDKSKRRIVCRLYRKYYFICFKSFSYKYKIFGLMNILLKKA